MSKKGKITVDLGNSETRVNIEIETPKGDTVTEDIFLSNKFYKYETNSVDVPSAYNPENSSIIKISGGYTGAYANGDIVEKEYPKSCIKPTAKKTKASLTSALSFALSVTKAIDLIAKKYDVDFNDIDYAWDVLALMPPAQCTERNIKAFEEELEKIQSVTNCFNSYGGNGSTIPVKIPVKVNKVTVLPEGFAAYVGCMYNRDVEIRKGYESYIEGTTTLVIDIGAGTTDILIIVDGEVIDNSKETFDYGGLNVRAKVKRFIKDEYGYNDILDSDLEEVVSTGKLKDGSKYIDVSELVMLAKKEVSKSLVGEIQDYLNDIEYPLRKIEGALVVGGGTLGGIEGSNIEPLSVSVMENLRTYSPNMGEVELPIITDKNGNSVKMSPRVVNFEGACVLAKAQ